METIEKNSPRKSSEQRTCTTSDTKTHKRGHEISNILFDMGKVARIEASALDGSKNFPQRRVTMSESLCISHNHQTTSGRSTSESRTRGVIYLVPIFGRSSLRAALRVSDRGGLHACHRLGNQVPAQPPVISPTSLLVFKRELDSYKI